MYYLALLLIVYSAQTANDDIDIEAYDPYWEFNPRSIELEAVEDDTGELLEIFE